VGKKNIKQKPEGGVDATTQKGVSPLFRAKGLSALPMWGDIPTMKDTSGEHRGTTTTQ
jgi:hypothetical protein